MDDLSLQQLCDALRQRPLGGRASYMVGENAQHYFSLLSPAVDVWNARVPQELGWYTRLNDGGECEMIPRQWSVQSSGLEIVREAAGGGNTPLTASQLAAATKGQAPVGVLSPGSLLALEARILTQGGTRTIRFDVGETFTVLAMKIDVSVLAPANASLIRLEGVQPQLGAGTLADSKISVGLNEVEDSRACGCTVRFTERVGVLGGGAQATIAIPPHAQTVSVLQGANGGAPTNFGLFVGLPAGLKSVGQFGFVGREATDIPVSGATHMQTNADAAARTYTITWTIKV